MVRRGRFRPVLQPQRKLIQAVEVFKRGLQPVRLKILEVATRQVRYHRRASITSLKVPRP